MKGIRKFTIVATVISLIASVGSLGIWLFFIPYSNSHADIAFVRTSNKVTNGGTSVAATYAATPTQNDLLVAIVGTSTSVTINTPSGWTSAIKQSGAPGQAIFYKIAGASESTTVTVTVSASTRLGLHIYEYSGVDTSSPLDTTASSTGTGTTVSSGSLTTTNDADLLIAGLVTVANTSFSSWTNSFTQRNNFANGGAVGSRATYGGAERLVTSTGTYSTAATAASGAWRGQIVAFKTAPSTYTQAVYRVFANANSTNVGSALAASNTPATLTATGDQFRVRMLIKVATSTLQTSGEDFKLQYVGKGTGTCASPSGGTPSAYTDVTTATLISYFGNTTPTDGAALTANASDPVNGADTIVNQSYEEANNFTNAQGAIAAGADGKWDFSLYDNGAAAGATYCLRAVLSTGTVLGTYSAYPEITTAAGVLSVNIVDGSGATVGSPSYAFASGSTNFTCGTSTATMGTSTQKIRVTNTTRNAKWTLDIAPTSGATATWTNGTTTYDVNDPTGTPAGCSDGPDADTVAGQLSINPSVGTLTPQSGCTNTNVALGSSTAFNQGVVNSVNLTTANTGAQTGCYWDLTNVSLSQTIPAEQRAGAYTINMTITATAF